jgi:hypothetical protein
MRSEAARLLRRYVQVRGGSRRGYRRLKRWWSRLPHLERAAIREKLEATVELAKEVRGVRA